ncbi:TetR/AcrR family transcriptional regulator [Leptospira fluminis]|uniref:TetR/AcrR family transcriptional regulator n=1 Tax=Leptospira fluminis TaxID=2484979 RepID=A0A4R9GNJ6_9LEPT|nr:TetR/AcrR family transcriptional regulator [Leptospira fluminis]TGK17996.1 TetR/AcrR family transcriptional regulator [Leptospira fluminis]
MENKNLAELPHYDAGREPDSKRNTTAYPKEEGTFEETSKVSKNKIIAVAVHLFGKKGFFETHIPDIASTARVGVGTIYRTFRNKDHLFNEVFRACILEFAVFLQEKAQPAVSKREIFFSLWENLHEFSQERNSEFSFLNRYFDSPYLDEESRVEFEALKAKIAGVFCTIEGDPKEEISTVCVSLVLGSFFGLMRFRNETLTDSDPSFVSRYAEMIWDGLAKAE